MQKFRKELDRLLVQLTWSLWTEIGVAGVQRMHVRHAIDPEPLIIITAALQDTDPRLRDESMDWCIRYLAFISKTRLRNLLNVQVYDATKKAFGQYAATINAQTRAQWPVPVDVKPRSFTPSGKASADFSRPALVRLRMRALFGVGARAELLTTFLGEPNASKSASEFVAVGYAKRIVAQILSELHMSGLLEVTPVRNRIYYRLARARVNALQKLAAPLPDYFLDWSTLLSFLAAARYLAIRSESTSWRASAVGVNRLIQWFAASLASFGELPRSEAALDTYWHDAAHWILSFTQDLAEGRVPRRSRSTSRRLQ